jgi:hypothetical protein
MHRQQHEELKRHRDQKILELKAAKSKLYPLDRKIDTLKRKKEEMDTQMKSKVGLKTADVYNFQLEIAC